MKRIGEELEFEMKLTTYVARHSFATILIRSGAPLALASQTLGHSNILTTQKYFAGFDLNAQAEYMKALTTFKKYYGSEGLNPYAITTEKYVIT